jgi:hypothetical protein
LIFSEWFGTIRVNERATWLSLLNRYLEEFWLMNLKMIRLSKPNPDNLFSNYENQLEPQYFFASSVSKTLFENSQKTLLQIAENEIREYINNDDLCNDEEGMFPKRSVLTGEWYISSVSFEDDILSIEAALLGTDLGYPDDYLGLELIFIYDDESKEFAFDGINSSAL